MYLQKVTERSTTRPSWYPHLLHINSLFGSLQFLFLTVIHAFRPLSFSAFKIYGFTIRWLYEFHDWMDRYSCSWDCWLRDSNTCLILDSSIFTTSSFPSSAKLSPIHVPYRSKTKYSKSYREPRSWFVLDYSLIGICSCCQGLAWGTGNSSCKNTLWQTQNR